MFSIRIVLCFVLVYKYAQSIPLMLNDTNLDKVKGTTFLGIQIDENLTWKKNNDVNEYWYSEQSQKKILPSGV